MKRRTFRTTAIVCSLVVLSGCASRLDRTEIVAAQTGGAPVAAGAGVQAGVDPSTIGGTAPGTAPGTDTGAGAVPGTDAGTAAPAAGPGQAGTAPGTGGAGPAASPGGTTTNSTGSKGNTGTGGAAPAAKANNLPITVGFIGSITGLYGTSFRPVLNAIQANLTDLNARGGINGHPVKLIVADDAGDPSTYVAQVRRMVESDKVLAFVGNTHAASLSQAAINYIESKQIPVLDGDDSNLLAPTSHMIFGFGAAGLGLNGTEFAAARDLVGKGKKAGFISCQEVQQCADYAAGFAEYSKKAGFTPVFAGRASLTAPDFTANCLQARNANAEVLFLRIDINSVKRIARDCSRQGYKPIYVTAPVLTDPSYPANPAFDKIITPSQQFPFINEKLSEEKRFRSVMSRVIAADQIFAAHAQGWNVANIFAEAVTRGIAPDATPTTEGILKGLWSFKNVTLDGTSQPLTYVKGKPPAHLANVCAFPMQIQNGKWTAPFGNKPSCL